MAGAVIPAIVYANPNDPQCDLILSGHSPAPARLCAGYIDIQSASVSKLDDGSYVFSMTFYGTIPDVPLNPANGKPVVILRYVWRLYDQDGNLVARVRLSWNSLDATWFARYGEPGPPWTLVDFLIGPTMVTVNVVGLSSLAYYWDAVAWIDNKPGLWFDASDSAMALGCPVFLWDGYEGGTLP